MPMVPSVLAVATYGSLKVAGYAGFSLAVNKYSAQHYSPIKFGFLKTFYGLIGGLAFLFLLSFMPKTIDISNTESLMLAIPIRFLVWYLLISYCYSNFGNKRDVVLLSTVGVVLSYSIDFAMVALFNILPGMEMPFC